MDYGRLIKDAWSMAWRHKFLWLIGMFAPSSIGSCSGSNSFYRVPNFPGLPQANSGAPSLRPEFNDLGPATDQVMSWLESNAATLVALIAALTLLTVVFIVLSLVAQGAMVRSTGDIVSNLPSSLRTGLRAGLRHFWRYLGLWAITAGVGLAIAVAVAVVVAIGIIIATAGGPAAAAVVTIAGVLIGIPLALVAILGGIAVGVILAFARRAIVLSNSGPISAIRTGFLLFRDRPGQSLLAWLVSVGLGIGIAIVTSIAAITAIFVLAIPALIGAAVASWSPVVIAYAVVAGVAFLMIAWVVGGALNALFWSYWTLAYLRISGGTSEPSQTASPTRPPLEHAGGAAG
jgi:hypothetical protein